MWTGLNYLLHIMIVMTWITCFSFFLSLILYHTCLGTDTFVAARPVVQAENVVRLSECRGICRSFFFLFCS
jgi:hypothetical protein